MARPRAKTYLLMTVALTAALAVAACGSKDNTGSSSGTLKIGVPVPLSGDYASAGNDILHGAQLAAAAINSAGGVNGHKIELISADDACGAQVGAQAAQKLISQGVVAVAGGYCSSAALPELAAFHRSGIAYVMDASTNPQLTEQGYAEAFRTIGRDDEQGPFAAEFISGYLKAKTAAVVNDNTTYSKGLADNAVASLKQAGVTVVYNNSITPGQSDYTPVLTKIKQLHPDVLYYTGYFAEAGLIVKQAKQLGLTAQIMGGDATNDPTLISTAGVAANGMIVTTAPLVQFLSAGSQYVTDYKAKYSGSPGAYSVYEYDAIQAVAKAAAAANSMKAADILAALKSLSFTGITGPISFNSKGDRSLAVYTTVTVKDGAFAGFKNRAADGTWVDAS